MGAVTERDPLELRVLAALRKGVESATTVSSRLAVDREDVAAILDRGVLDGLVSRLDLAGTPVYSLTSAGHDVVGDAPSGPVAVADPQPLSDPEVAVPTVTSAENSHVDRGADPLRPPEADAAAPVQPRERPAAGKIAWRHALYAVAYVVLGLGFLVFLHAWVGIVAVVGGLVLGAFALRPLLQATDAPGQD